MTGYWAALCRDGDDAAVRRKDCLDEHVAYMRGGNVRVRIAGPLLADENGISAGSLLILESNDRSEVESFLTSSPFFRHGVWSQLKIQAFHPVAGDTHLAR